VLRQIPDSDGVQQLLNHMVEEDSDRRAQESASYIRDAGDIRDLGYVRDSGQDDWDGDWHGTRDGSGGRPTSVL
jgi:hypothetical protein